ncbi:tyrosine-type recombinase/integrase [Actinocorallia sp. API 0066]|uniref:tyrosine-type recombinase/integrase n=1 Tax=Actinocorallia sp. API 0066 TaxID=2896846 RepID=UPI001E3595A6|nr:tyrosine-type recombinase/integrase [Actinocorallia sp. API 0066]
MDADGHIPCRWFQDHAWRPALHGSNLPVKVCFQDLRHAHASWSLAGGTDLTAVKDRLGHANIATTSGALHALDGADEDAIDAFATVRHRIPPAGPEA